MIEKIKKIWANIINWDTKNIVESITRIITLVIVALFTITMLIIVLLYNLIIAFIIFGLDIIYAVYGVCYDAKIKFVSYIKYLISAAKNLIKKDKKKDNKEDGIIF